VPNNLNFNSILGGTVDITGHERTLHNGGIKEICGVSGTDKGGRQVNKKFDKLLENIFSPNKWKTIKRETPVYWLDIMKRFEERKRMDISMSNGHCIEKSKLYSWESLKSRINEFAKGSKIVENQLIIPVEIIHEMVREVCEEIVEFIIKQLHLSLDLDAILLVGGFANSKIIFDGIKKSFGGIPVITPEKSELCVVKGAVLFGWKKNIIRSRKSKYTYSVRLLGNRLEELVKSGEDIRYDEIRKCYVTHSSLNLPKTCIKLICSNHTVNEDKDMGYFFIEKPKEARGRSIELDIFFGDTEIHLKATDEVSGKTSQGNFKFLCEGKVDYDD